MNKMAKLYKKNNRIIYKTLNLKITVYIAWVLKHKIRKQYWAANVRKTLFKRKQGSDYNLKRSVDPTKILLYLVLL